MLRLSILSCKVFVRPFLYLKAITLSLVAVVIGCVTDRSPAYGEERETAILLVGNSGSSGIER